MDLWKRGSLLRNPYWRTAFRVARVPRNVSKRRTLVHLITQTKQIIRSSPGSHTVVGEAVTEADVNAAEQILLDPQKRFVEELLEHKPEALPLDRVREVLEEVKEAVSPASEEPLAAQDLRWLEPWTQAVMTAYLDTVSTPGPVLGRLELEIPPPTGHVGA